GARGPGAPPGYAGPPSPPTARGAPPFNRPTNLAVAPNGDLYVTDGYGNARVHRFAADGRLLASWGAPGGGPGELRIPHGICILADGRVLVADRENDRIQVFDLGGTYLEEWRDIQRPTHLCVGRDGLIYVAELWWRTGQRSPRFGEITADRYGRVSALRTDGSVVARWGGSAPGTPGGFTAPYGIAVDSRGDVYVAEVTYTFGVAPGVIAPGSAPTLQKLARRQTVTVPGMPWRPLMYSISPRCRPSWPTDATYASPTGQRLLMNPLWISSLN